MGRTSATYNTVRFAHMVWARSSDRFDGTERRSTPFGHGNERVWQAGRYHREDERYHKLIRGKRVCAAGRYRKENEKYHSGNGEDKRYRSGNRQLK